MIKGIACKLEPHDSVCYATLTASARPRLRCAGGVIATGKNAGGIGVAGSRFGAATSMGAREGRGTRRRPSAQRSLALRQMQKLECWAEETPA
jgi:hypothetical protein